MNQARIKKEKRDRRHKKIRAKIFGTKEKPRLSVYKSNKHLSAQLIDDENSKTLFGIHSTKVSGKNMKERSTEVGKEIAKKALSLKIKKIVFDRGGFIYTGNIEALANGAREGGLDF